MRRSVAALALLALFATACTTAPPGPERDASGAVVETTLVSVLTLRAGDCFDDPPVLTATFDEVEVVPCGLPHDNEIFFAYEMAEASFPGNDAAAESAFLACLAEFESFVGSAYDGSVYDLFPIHPSRDTWEDGDRTVYCVLYSADLSPIVGSVAGSGRSTAAPESTSPLPPHDRDSLAEVFDPLVAPLGYRVTRAALITRATYLVDPEGDHLAIYLAPLEDISPDRVATDLPLIARVFLPAVFDRWPALASFDVCQEPYASPDETPPSLTIVDVTRDAAEQVEWAEIDLVTLVGDARIVDGLTVWAHEGVRTSSPWQEAVEG